MARSTIPLTLSIRQVVHDALTSEAKAKNFPGVSDLANDILERHVLGANFMPQQERDDLELLRQLTDEVKQEAHHIINNSEQFPDSITKMAIEACCSRPDWLKRYETYVKSDPFKHGNPRKASINPNFGYWVKKSLGARSKMKNGKPENRKVRGSIIQSYTPLER